jgi:hypothetical protein
MEHPKHAVLAIERAVGHGGEANPVDIRADHIAVEQEPWLSCVVRTGNRGDGS